MLPENHKTIILLYCIVLYCIVLYCIVLYCIVLYCIVLYCIVLYCIVLYCIVLYCIVLYCIVHLDFSNLIVDTVTCKSHLPCTGHVVAIDEGVDSFCQRLRSRCLVDDGEDTEVVQEDKTTSTAIDKEMTRGGVVLLPRRDIVDVRAAAIFKRRLIYHFCNSALVLLYVVTHMHYLNSTNV